MKDIIIGFLAGVGTTSVAGWKLAKMHTRFKMIKLAIAKAKREAV